MAETKADSADGFNPIAGLSQFLAEPRKVRVDGAGIAVRLKPPHGFKQGFAGLEFSPGLDEFQKEGKFGLRQIDGLVLRFGLKIIFVDFQVPDT